MNDSGILFLIIAGICLLAVVGGLIGDSIDRAIWNRAERAEARRRNPRP